MGYYNFYRLIREIRYLFSNKKIKKLLTIIIIFIIVILILHNKGYCAIVYPPYHNNDLYYELQITPITVVNLKFDNGSPNKLEQVGTYDHRYGGYFELMPDWDYYISIDSGVYNWGYCDEPPVVGTTISGNRNLNTSDHWYNVSDNARWWLSLFLY